MSVITAIITPFKSNGEVDYESFERLIKFQIKSVDKIVIFGTTGESPTLELDEKIKLLEELDRILEENYVGFKKNIIIGFGGNDTKSVIREMKYFERFSDFNTWMLSAPYYNKPNQRGIYKHFSVIMEEFSEKSFMIYNIPSRTGVNILPETIIRLNDKYDVYGVKEASGYIEQCITLINNNIDVYSGDDSLGHMIMELGGKGVVSVASNLYPEMVRDFLENENKRTIEKYDLMFIETNPVPIKYMMRRDGLIENESVRLPLVELSEESKERINKFD